jgi:SAM-dependent methyltransferase
VITFDLKQLKLIPDDRVLDIGCGTGRHAGAIYARYQIFVIAADRQTDDIVQARDRFRLHDRLDDHKGGSWAVSAMDINHLPFPDESFDLVICSEVLEHIPDQCQAIGELARVLKKGRSLVVSVPRYFPEKICWGLSYEYRDTPAGHIRIYRRKMIINLLENAGLKPWRVHFAHSLHTPFWWLKCLVGPRRTDVTAVNLYQRFLTWDILKEPPGVRFIDHLLNPLMGKSLVIYSRKS